MKFSGRTWLLGDNIDTGVIISSKYTKIVDKSELARHVFEGFDKRFASNVRKGDIIVAGRNFGCGSSRETAPIALKAAGIGAIAAKSFARIFFRNAVNIGLPLLECPDIPEIEQGMIVEIDVSKGTMTLESGKVLESAVFPDFILEIIDAGGLVPLKQKQYGNIR